MSDVPQTVACPCGHGYAERRPRPIWENVSRRGTAERKVQLTFMYRHEGCPIGGHIVTVAGCVRRRAGPLFDDNPPVERLRAFAGARPLAADGGEPQ